MIATLVGSEAGPLEESRIQGGLAVVIGGDANLVNEIGRNEKFLIQMLDTDAAQVKTTQAVIREAGIYGRVNAVVIDVWQNFEFWPIRRITRMSRTQRKNELSVLQRGTNLGVSPQRPRYP